MEKTSGKLRGFLGQIWAYFELNSLSSQEGDCERCYTVCMTPQEIKQLLQQSAVLREAWATKRATVWPFLREKVHVIPMWGEEHTRPVQLIFGIPAVTVIPHMERCPNCQRDSPYDTFVVSPYNCSARNLEYLIISSGTQWCIDCTLQAFLTDDDTYEQKRRDILDDNNFQSIPEGVWWS